MVRLCWDNPKLLEFVEYCLVIECLDHKDLLLKYSPLLKIRLKEISKQGYYNISFLRDLVRDIIKYLNICMYDKRNIDFVINLKVSEAINIIREQRKLDRYEKLNRIINEI